MARRPTASPEIHIQHVAIDSLRPDAANPQRISEATGLLLLDRARQALAEASSVDEVKAIRNQAEAVRAYLKQQGAALEMQNQCAEIKLRAERRLGELLAALPKLHGARPADAGSHDVTPLADLGIGKMQSHRWQAVAAVPDEAFERHVAETRERGEELTTASVLRLGRVVQGRHRAETVAAPPERSADSNGIIPLELMWPTAQFLLRSRAGSYLRCLGDLRQISRQRHAWKPIDPPVLEQPGVGDALARLEAAMLGVEQALASAAVAVERAAAEIGALAEASADHPIPPADQRELFLVANARQKNSRGYCGIVGCWQRVDAGGFCPAHAAEGQQGPCAEQPPAEVVEPAAPGTTSGARPGWSSWGLEALEAIGTGA